MRVPRREKYMTQHEKMALIAYADNEGPDQTAHSRSLIWAFVVRLLVSK